MRDVLRRCAYLAMVAFTLAAVWVAAKHPPEPDALYITADGQFCDRPPPGKHWSCDEFYVAEEESGPAPEGPVAAASPVGTAGR
ncbi:MAG TPA: hypothetical protein VFB66_30835 [Tepidisphaeraceae bacterium]|nr:hypothetical protein [Tepidisphaeraceae bacterium]